MYSQSQTIKIINFDLLDLLTSQAKSNPRLRQHLNLHDSYEDPSQRLLNAMEPGSYIRPHRHLKCSKTECFIGIRGKLALLIFNDKGEIENVFSFGPSERIAGADLPPGTWHTVICLESGSVFLETKPGPFDPIHRKDMAPWAPAEGSVEAVIYLQQLIDLTKKK